MSESTEATEVEATVDESTPEAAEAVAAEVVEAPVAEAVAEPVAEAEVAAASVATDDAPAAEVATEDVEPVAEVADAPLEDAPVPAEVVAAEMSSVRQARVFLCERGHRVTVPATALAQAIRSPARQARLSRLVRQPSTDLVALDGADATRVGVLLARTRTSDIVDAHVVVCGRRLNQPVVTSDPADLRQLDPTLPLVIV